MVFFNLFKRSGFFPLVFKRLVHNSILRASTVNVYCSPSSIITIFPNDSTGADKLSATAEIASSKQNFSCSSTSQEAHCHQNHTNNLSNHPDCQYSCHTQGITIVDIVELEELRSTPSIAVHGDSNFNCVGGFSTASSSYQSIPISETSFVAGDIIIGIFPSKYATC